MYASVTGYTQQTDAWSIRESAEYHGDFPPPAHHVTPLHNLWQDHSLDQF